MQFTATQSSFIRIMCVDDLSYWRKFISFVLRPESDLKVVCEASGGVSALALMAKLRPTVVLLDLQLPKLSGLEVAKQGRILSAESKVVFVSEESDPAIVARALEIGASGYVLKYDVARDLARAIHTVTRGEAFISSGLLPNLPAHS